MRCCWARAGGLFKTVPRWRLLSAHAHQDQQQGGVLRVGIGLTPTSGRTVRGGNVVKAFRGHFKRLGRQWTIG